MAHREDIREYFKNISLEGLAVIDWGCGTKPITNYLKGTPSHYFSLDKLTHVGATEVWDIVQPYQCDREYDIAFCLEVLEHVTMPNMVVANICNSLKQGGRLYLSVPFQYPVHSDEDYWRFTDQGMKYLLEMNGFKLLDIKPTEEQYGWTLIAEKI